MKKMNKKGFTIVELVIVIAVIAILAAVLIPTFTGIIKKGQDSATLQEANAAYKIYVASRDYASGATAEQSLVVKVGDKYVAVMGAKMQDEIYNSANAAAVAAGITATANPQGVTANDYVVVEKSGESVTVTPTELIAG